MNSEIKEKENVMYLVNIPEEIKKLIFNLQADELFQEIFRNDYTLDYLEAQKRDKNILFHELLLMLNKRLRFKNIQFNAITLALYGYLYCIKSNIIFDIENVTLVDLDVFFYLLQTRDYTDDVTLLLNKSRGYVLSLLFTYKEALTVYNLLCKFSYKVFSLFPKTSTNENHEPIYNVDWIVGLVSRVKPLTSYSTLLLYTKISLSLIYYYYSHYLRMRGNESIFTRNNELILDEMDSRMIDLVLDRLIFKKVITNEERDELFTLLKTSPLEKKDNG